MNKVSREAQGLSEMTWIRCMVGFLPPECEVLWAMHSGVSVDAGKQRAQLDSLTVWPKVQSMM
jgi:hypothetical protein